MRNASFVACWQQPASRAVALLRSISRWMRQRGGAKDRDPRTEKAQHVERSLRLVLRSKAVSVGGAAAAVSFAASDTARVRSWQILLQKSKIEELQKSRESRLFDVFVAAGSCGIDTAAGGRSGAKRCGPSRRRVQNTRASLKNFTGQSKKTFSTLSRNERTSP